MCAPVSSEFILPVEASAAKFARERPFSRVNHCMPGEVVLLREASPAHVTMEGPISAMGSHVVQ